jgi:peptidoglycan/LPS O-acetylase OafA/YrhL
MPVWIPLLLMYWVVWAMGALVAEAYAGRIRVPRLRWMALACLAGLAVLVVTLGQFSAHPGWWRVYDLAWGAGMAVLLAYLLLAAPRRLGPGIERSARLLARLGDISYSLYVVHLPWLVLVSAWWLSWHSTLPKGAELAVPGVLSGLLLAGLCWYFVERHFVSQRSERKITHAAPQPTASSAALGAQPSAVSSTAS